MRNLVYVFLAVLCLPVIAVAQLSEARLPQALLTPLEMQYIPRTVYDLPDWQTYLKTTGKETAAPFRVGLPVAAAISFPASGIWTVLPDGRQVWRAQVQVAGAPAIGFYYDKFELPPGAALFLSNANGRQVLGAYTFRNNTDDGRFAHEAVQGGLVNLELDLEAGVSPQAVQLHIDQLLVYFRSYEYLEAYAAGTPDQPRPTDVDDLHLEGGASLCNINAICPLGQYYPMARKASIQTIYPNGTLCSATMINNTGNTTADCKQYLLSATHCQEGNSTSDAAFSQLLIRFNFEKEQCSGGPAAQVNTLTGAYFRARANYVAANPPALNGDFLLLELKSKIPAAWDVYLAGWNKAATLPASLSYPQQYTIFHYPAGDVKKIASKSSISPDGNAGGSLGTGTHWQIYPIDSGGIEGGSSGSGLFDGEGRLVGITSLAGDANPDCAATGKAGVTTNYYTYALCSKLSLDWDYALDGSDNYRKLRPWLDPANSGVITLDGVKADCSSPGTGIIQHDDQGLEETIGLAPNPVTQGRLTVITHLPGPEILHVAVYDVSGRLQGSYDAGKVHNSTFTLDMSGLAGGMYLLKFQTAGAVTTKRIMVLQ